MQAPGSTGQPVYERPAPAIGYGNFTALAPPTADDDEYAGYSINSVWFVPSTGRFWKCVDATAGAADWRELLAADAIVFERRAASVTLDLDDTGEQTAFSVPAGFDFVLSRVFLLFPSEDISLSPDSVFLFDRDGVPVFEEFFTDYNAVNKSKQIVPGGAFPVFTAGDAIKFQMSGAYGSAATIQADIWGYFRAAEAVTTDYLTDGAGNNLTDASGNYLTE